MDHETERPSDASDSGEPRPLPPDDSLAEDRMFARVSEAMFGAESAAPRVGGYYVLEQIGRGGMGTVYAAYDADLDRRVAVKILHGHEQSDETARARLLREARALARLTHPNVVTVHAVGTSDRGVYLAMEYIEGRTLAEFMADDPPLDEILEVFLGAARGLAAAHAQGLVHRDFKPHNVLLGSDDVPRVADFGLARPAESAAYGAHPLPQNVPTLDDSTPLTRTGGLLGTPAYMAPEQYAASSVGPAADQYAFCVSLYEATFGELPFRADTLAAVAEAKLSSRIEFPSDRGTPRWLLRLLERGLQPDPAARWPDMDTLLGELERGRGQASRRRRWLAVGAGTILIASLVWLGRGRDDEAVDPCDPEHSAMHPVWNPARADALPIPAKLRRRLDDYARTWMELDEKTCREHASGRLSARTSDARNRCLERTREAFDYNVELLERNDPAIVESARRIVGGLRDVAHCDFDANAVPLRDQASEPGDRALAREAITKADRAHALRGVGKGEEADALVRELWDMHEQIADPWARAEVQRLAALTILEGEDKEAAMRGALNDAIRSGHYQLQGFAYLDLADIVYKREGRDEAWALLASADAAADAMAVYGEDNPGVRHWAELIRGRVDNMRGVFAKNEGRAESLPWFEQALEHWSFRADRDPDRVLMAEHNVGEGLRDQGRAREAIPHFESSLELALELYPPSHPYVLQIRSNLASAYVMAGQLGPAKAALDTAIGDLGGRRSDLAAELFNNRGMARTASGDLDGAREDFDEAEAIWKGGGPKSVVLAEIAVAGRAAVMRRLGRASNALVELRGAIERLEGALGAEHPVVAQARLELAMCLAESGDREAVEQAERARRDLEASVGLAGALGAQTWRTMAFCRSRTGGSQRQADAEYDRAIVIYRELGGPEHYAIDEIERERASRRGPSVQPDAG